MSSSESKYKKPRAEDTGWWAWFVALFTSGGAQNHDTAASDGDSSTGESGHDSGMPEAGGDSAGDSGGDGGGGDGGGGD